MLFLFQHQTDSLRQAPNVVPISLATPQSDSRKPSNRDVVVPRSTAITTKGLPFVILRALRGSRFFPFPQTRLRALAYSIGCIYFRRKKTRVEGTLPLWSRLDALVRCRALHRAKRNRTSRAFASSQRTSENTSR